MAVAVCSASTTNNPGAVDFEESISCELSTALSLSPEQHAQANSEGDGDGDDGDAMMEVPSAASSFHSTFAHETQAQSKHPPLSSAFHGMPASLTQTHKTQSPGRVRGNDPYSLMAAVRAAVQRQDSQAALEAIHVLFDLGGGAGSTAVAAAAAANAEFGGDSSGLGVAATGRLAQALGVHCSNRGLLASASPLLLLDAQGAPAHTRHQQAMLFMAQVVFSLFLSFSLSLLLFFSLSFSFSFCIRLLSLVVFSPSCFPPF